METILDRIEQFAENQGVKIGAFEKKIGASKGVLSRAIAQKTDIQAKWLVKIVENYPQIDANWLLTGEGSMYRSPAVMNEAPPPDRDEVVRLLREKVADQQKIIGLLEDKIERLTGGSTSTNIEAAAG
jgi:hypothetical protein